MSPHRKSAVQGGLALCVWEAWLLFATWAFEGLEGIGRVVGVVVVVKEGDRVSCAVVGGYSLAV